MVERNKKIIEIPSGIDVKAEDKELIIKGQKGEIKRKFDHPAVDISIKGSDVLITSKLTRRKVIAVVGSWAAHVRNMIAGVQNGYEAKLKMVYTHFPVKMSVEGNMFKINNFMGEKKPRTVNLPDGVETKIDKNDVIIKGIDKELVGKAAALIEQITAVRGFDKRVFQDGCYLVEKTHLVEENN